MISVEKIVILTDTHLGVRKGHVAWHEATTLLFQRVRDFCVSNSIKKVIFLGDFFDTRKFINVLTLILGYNIVKSLTDLEVYLILGNHDCFYKDKPKPSSLEIFKDLDNVKLIIDKPIEVDIGVRSILVPWNHPIPEDNCVLFGHLSIIGFPMNNHKEAVKGLELTSLKGYRRIYSGHFHKTSRKDNVFYIGSPLQQTFHDEGEKTGFYVLSNGDVTEFIEFNEGPKFHTLHTEKEFTEEQVKNNIVKLVYDKDYGTLKNNEILSKVEVLKPLMLETDFSISKEYSEVTEEEIKTTILGTEELIEEYIENLKKVPENINKKMLKNMFLRMLKE